MSDVHLFVICHGLWGAPDNVQSIVNELERRARGESGRGDDPTAEDYSWATPLRRSSADIELRVIVPKTNESVLTYDGIDTCALRAVKEMDDELAAIAKEGKRVTRLSFVGYSLGGLIARYAIGVLYARKTFEEIEPCSFTTFASPALGQVRYKSTLAAVGQFLGPRLLSRSGLQLYGQDRHVTSGKFSGKSLIELLAEPESVFFKALSAFERIDIIANAVNDRTVPYPTAALASEDPFAEAMTAAYASRKKRRAIDSIDGDNVDPVKIEEGGLKVILDDRYNVMIEKWVDVEPEIGPRRPKELVDYVPAVFKPSTYFWAPKRRRVLYAAFWPILIPGFITFVLASSAVQNLSSRRRIALLSGPDGLVGDEEAQLRRIGLHERRGSFTAGVMQRRNSIVEEGFEAIEPSSATDLLSKSQRRMAANLRSIPHLKVHLAYLPQVRNSHGTIIARDSSGKVFPLHKHGRAVIRAWLDEFAL